MTRIYYIAFILSCFCLSANGQTIRSVSQLEVSPIGINPSLSTSSYLNYLYGEQTLMYRRRFNNDHIEKDSYWFNSIYYKDSLVGLKFLGFEFNFLHEKPESKWLSKFRYWNRLRIGFSLNTEYKLGQTWYTGEDILYYFNSSIYVDFLHICKSSRCDKTTRFRRGNWGFHAEMEYSLRWLGDLYIKPFSFAILHFRYRKAFTGTYAGLLLEWQFNRNAYDNCAVEATKDQYNGFTLIAGLEYRHQPQLIMFTLGGKLDLRNH